MNEFKDALIPQIGVVTDIRKDTPDVKTFRVVTPSGEKPFSHMPGGGTENNGKRSIRKTFPR